MDFNVKRRMYHLMILMLLICIVLSGKDRYQEWQKSHSGVPDVVNSMSVNGYHYLTVIANSKKIEDKEDFAREVISMCQQNAFRSVKFSTGVNGYPTGLDITVYLMRSDIEEKEPVCRIKFVTDDRSGKYDIKNDPDKYQLYLNGEEIAFY